MIHVGYESSDIAEKKIRNPRKRVNSFSFSNDQSKYMLYLTINIVSIGKTLYAYET